MKRVRLILVFFCFFSLFVACDSESKVPDNNVPVFSTQPKTMNISPGGASIDLKCSVSNVQHVEYQWYESTNVKIETGMPIENATSSTYSVPSFSENEKGIRYYFCTARNLDAKEPKIVYSNVVSVAYTGLPTVYVNTPEHAEITSKEKWMKNATISLAGSVDGLWDFTPVNTSIRGRGNSTWGAPKKPYAIKLNSGMEIMGMPSHTRWVLIANYYDNSFMKNSIAFYLSEVFEMAYTVRGQFVDLVLNGEYRGVYWLGEAIKEDINRVNIDEDDDYLIEMDVYFDEDWRFYSSIRNMPYMIKNDDSMTDEKLQDLETRITNLETLLYPDGDSAPDDEYVQYLDVTSFAKFWLINEIMDNGELNHPKCCYFTFDTSESLLKAGPVWDFDYSALSDEQSSCRLKNSIYYNALFKSPTFVNKVQEVWNTHKTQLDVEIENKINELRDKLNVAQTYDSMLWGVHLDPSQIQRDNYDAYVDYLKAAINNKMELIESDLNP